MERYSRQLKLIGKNKQKKMAGSRVTVIGAGGLGSSALLYLAAAGVGRIRIVDYERVELSNLNRQVIYTEKDIGKKKSTAAAKRLRELNGEISVETMDAKVDAGNAGEIIRGSDVVLDCLDNWDARFVVNRACVEEKIPFIHGAVEGMEGQLMVVRPEGACLACVFSEKLSAEKKEFDVIGFAPGVVGCMEGMEAVKIITGKEGLRDELLLIDLETDEFQKIKVSKKEGCEVCG